MSSASLADAPAQLLPHDLDAEKAVLGAVMINNQLFNQAADILDSHDFFRDAHRRIFQRMIALTDRGDAIDLITLKNELVQSAELDEVGGPAYIAGLTDGVPRSANVEYYAKIIKDKSTLRRVIQSANEVLVRAYDGQSVGDILTLAHQDLKVIADAADRQVDQHLERQVTSEIARERVKREARRRLDAEARGSTVALDIGTLRDRLARPVTETEFRIEHWQPRGSRVLLAAQFKAGKTTFIGGLIRSLVDGDRFLGRDYVSPVRGKVVLIDTEMSSRQLDDWLRDQRIVNDDRVLVMALRGAVSAFDPIDPVIRSQWAESLRAAEAAYLIIDCIRPVMDALGLDEHRDAGRLLVAIDALLAEAGIEESCLVHHMGHVGERSRGDSRLRDWPDVEWRLVRQDENPSSVRYVGAYGRDVDEPEAALQWDHATRRLTIVGGSRRDAAATTALAAVLDVLKASAEPLSVRAIQKAMQESGHPRDTSRAAIKLGVNKRAIVAQPGPGGALLHSIPLDRAEVCGDRARTLASECAAAYIEPHARTLAGSGDGQ
jgi:hypothetical protein